MNFISHSLKKAFPVPRLLMLSHASVDLSDGLLRFFECRYKRGALVPKDFGTLPFPRLHGTTATEKTKAEASATVRAWAKNRKYKMVNAIMHEDEAYIFKATLPTTNPKEIRSAIEALLEENVPIPPADCLFEYDIIASDIKLKETTIAVSVISKTAVSEYLDIFKEGGVQVVSLETESRAIARALFPKNETGVHAVLVIAKHHTVVFIAEKGHVVFSSSIEVGQTDLVKAIEHKENVQLFEAMIPVFATLRDELNKVLVYWKAQGQKERHFIDISDVVLLGSDSATSGFIQYITSTTKIPAHIGSVWTNTLSTEETLPQIHKNESLDYGAVIGNLL